MPLDTTTAAMLSGPLATTTLATLRTYFDTKDHHPSADHWQALGDIARTLESMAEGTCPPSVFLSSVDPGVGKSQATLHFARALMASPDHAEVGMIICVGRKAEATAMAEKLADQRGRVAVLTSDEKINALGGESAPFAQVLITTQQRIEQATEGCNFTDLAGFRFRGHARQVRVWDEAWLPGVALSVDRDGIMGLMTTARKVSQDFREGLEIFSAVLKGVQTGDLISVPDWPTLYGVTIQDFWAYAPGGREGLRDDEVATATGVFMLAGRTAAVWKDNRTGSAFLSYRDTFPADLAPLLVLDASGRVRQTYADMSKHRDLKRLREAVKDYSPLTVHHWKAGGGKNAFAINAPQLLKGITDTILTKPTEKWLVVMHKRAGKGGNLEASLRLKLPPVAAENVKVITWGSHMATNDYADFGNLILAGTLFMRQGQYVALTHLAQDKPTAGGFATPEEIQRTTQVEHANFILQAICRGRVRKSDGDKCLAMDAYIIASARSGIRENLPVIFPGCRIMSWNPVPTTTDPKLKAALDYVQGELKAGAVWVGLTSIRRALKMNADTFRERITDTTHWKTEIKRMSLVDCGGPRNAKGLKVSPTTTTTPKMVKLPVVLMEK